jgi:hypothetical protein
MQLKKVLHFLALTGIFTSGMPMTYLPMSISQIAIILLFALSCYVTQFKTNKTLLIMFLYIFSISIIRFDYLQLENVVQFVRIFIYLTAYYMYLSIVGQEKINYILNRYFFLCVVFSVIGFIQIFGYFLNISLLYDFAYLDGFQRNFSDVNGIFKIMSLTQEPAHFALLLMPCVFFITKGFFVPGTYTKYNFTKKRIIIIFLAYSLTFSFVAYVSLAVIFAYHFLLSFKMNFKNVMILFAGCFFIFLFMFYLNTNISQKKESLFADESELQSSENLSAFALISNAQVAWNSANDNPIGTGFFTHKDNYDTYIYNFFSINEDSIILNRLDGSSMYVKILSEYSYVGLFFLLLLFYNIRYKGNDEFLKDMNRMAIVTLLVGFIRLANYTSPVFCFLFALAIYTKKDFTNKEICIANPNPIVE